MVLTARDCVVSKEVRGAPRKLVLDINGADSEGTLASPSKLDICLFSESTQPPRCFPWSKREHASAWMSLTMFP